MRRARVRLALAAPALACLLWAACGSRPGGDPAWREALQRDRATKDLVFHTPRGPLTPEQRPSFQALKYFAPDPSWNVRAAFESAAAPDTVRFVTSNGSFDVYLRAGVARFQHAGKDLSLTVYRNPQSGSYFVPFTDATSGDATYGAGRYLDPVISTPGAFSLDFNRAYNPYCAYNAGWVCPVAPPENHLDVAVEAGEKTFSHEH